MSKLSYLAKRVKEMDYARLRSTIRDTAKRAGKSKLLITCDMLGCALKYMAAPADYSLFAFYHLKPKERATYVTRGVNNLLVKKFNKPSDAHLLNNKNEFNQIFAKYLHRKWALLQGMSLAEFQAFMGDFTEIIYKPTSATCGWGIEKLKTADFPSMDAMHQELQARGGMIEEVLVQHEAMSRLHPMSINTLRLVTIKSEQEISIVFAFIRIGNGRVVDNLNSGGMAAPLDIATGRVTHPAADKDFLAYTAHPLTKEQIVGFVPPLYAEAVTLVKEAALTCPLGYVGWDVCITPSGPCLVEGNAYPGHDILQLPPHIDNHIGLKSRISQYL